MAQYDNKVVITSGRKLINQEPLGDRLNFWDVNDVQDNLNALDGAAIWYENMLILLRSANSLYSWVDESDAANNANIDISTKLLSTGFTYPAAVPTYGGRTFNYYKLFDETIVDKTYVYTQTTSSNVWTIQHNLDKEPAVQNWNQEGERIMGKVTYPNENQVIINFSNAVTGVSRLN